MSTDTSSQGTCSDLEQIEKEQNVFDHIRREAYQSATEAARLQKERHLVSRPPSNYSIGETVLVRLHRSISRRGWNKLPETPVTRKGTIVDVDCRKHRYQVRLYVDGNFEGTNPVV